MPYTAIINSALGIGLSMSDIRLMSWGQLVIMLQVKADTYKQGEQTEETTRDATWEEIKAWM